MESLNGVMVVCTKEIGRTESRMDRVYLQIKMAMM